MVVTIGFSSSVCHFDMIYNYVYMKRYLLVKCILGHNYPLSVSSCYKIFISQTDNKLLSYILKFLKALDQHPLALLID